MWTYRIEDADDTDIELFSYVFANPNYSCPSHKGIKKASGTVYVLMDNDGKDCGWIPITTDRMQIQKWFKVKD